MIDNELLLIPIVTGTLGVFSLAVLYRLVTREKAGTPDMQRIAGYVQEGAQAFIKREVRTIAYFIVGLVIVLFFFVRLGDKCRICVGRLLVGRSDGRRYESRC